MHTTSMGPKSILRSIPSKYLIRQIFGRFAPSVSIDWATGKRNFDNALAEATDALFRESPAEWRALTSTFEDIAIVCADRKTPERLLALMRGHPLSDSFQLYIGEDSSIQNGVCWLMLNDPEGWARLLIAAKAVRIRAKNSQVFSMIPQGEPDNERMDELTRAISETLVSELRHGNHAHVESVHDGECWRYFLSVNKYPNNVQQFDDEGRYGLSNDKTAENFMLEYCAGSLAVRCDYGIAIRRQLADCFARIMLNGRAIEPGKGENDLSRHLVGGALPKPSDPRIIAVRRTGIAIAYDTDEGKEQRFALSSDGLTDQCALMRRILEHLGVARQRARVNAVSFSFSLACRGGLRREIAARLTKHGVVINCRDREYCALIRHYLAEGIA